MIIPFRWNDAGASLYPEAEEQPHECAVRAIAIGLDKDYRDVWNDLNRWMDKPYLDVWNNLKHRKGIIPDDGVDHYTIRTYLESYGWHYEPKFQRNLKSLVEIFGSLPEPTIFRVKFSLQSHLSVLKHGEIHDKTDFWSEIGPKSILITDIFLHPTLR